MASKKYPLIGTKPGGTTPAIAGTRIRVAIIAEICKDIGEGPRTLGEIVEMYPHLTPDQIQAAIDYWHDNEDEIEAEIREEEEVVREMQATQEKMLPHVPSKP
jgi:uncharacterized protein (DUF433 family)